MIKTSIWKNNYNSFDICNWSKTDRKKAQKTTFWVLGRPKRRNFTPHSLNHLMTATKPENFIFAPGSVAVTKFGVFRYVLKPDLMVFAHNNIK